MTKTWSTDDFDSEIFGLKVVKIDPSVFVDQNPTEARRTIQKTLNEFIKNAVQYATVRLPQGNYQLIHTFEDAGFRLVDEMIDFELSIKNNVSYGVNPRIRKATLQDLEGLKKVASESWQLTRFFNDDFLPRDKSRLLYELWIENSLEGKVADAVFVWHEGKDICSYITLKKDGHIPLVAVLPEHQGKGISRKMVQAALHEFKSLGITKAYIETQVANIAAIRSYLACGFKPISSAVTLRWK